MKTIRLSYLLSALVGITFFMNSCSSSQQFAGYYPENRITGKGYGQSVGDAKKVDAPAASTASTTAASATTAAPVSVPEPAPTVNAIDAATPTVMDAKAQKGSRFMNWAMKAAEKNMQKIIASKNGQTHSLFGIKEKVSKRIFAKIAEKYGMDANDASTAASIERASKALAIVSFATGIAALVTFYGAFFFGPAAIATGVVALIGIKRGGDGKKWMAITGIVCGAVAMFLWIFLIGFFFAAWF